MLTGKLLPPVNNGLNFRQTHESAAEAACVGVAEEFGYVRQALARVREKAARDVQANIREHFAVACAHAPEMTLQRARADLEGAGSTIQSCVTVSQRRDHDGADRPG